MQSPKVIKNPQQAESVDTQRSTDIQSTTEFDRLERRLLSAKGQEDSVLKELIRIVGKQGRRITELENMNMQT